MTFDQADAVDMDLSEAKLGELRGLASRILSMESVTSEDFHRINIESDYKISLATKVASLLQQDLLSPSIPVLHAMIKSEYQLALFLGILSMHSIPQLERIVSEEVLVRLCRGECSPPRLLRWSNLGPHDRWVAAVASLVMQDSVRFEEVEHSLTFVILALVNGGDPLAIRDAVLEGTNVAGTDRISRYMDIWCQGNQDAVQRMKEIATSDAVEICEAALAIDGITDCPSFELEGVSACMHHAVSRDLAYVEPMCILLRKIFEKASELVEQLSCPPSIVVVDMLSHILPLLRQEEIDPTTLIHCDLQLEGDPCQTTGMGSFTELRLGVRLRPARWSIESVAGIVGQADAKLVLSPAQEEGVEIWSIRFLSYAGEGLPDSITAIARDGVYVFSVPCPQTTTEGGDMFFHNFLLNDRIPIRLSWRNPPVLTRRNTTTVPVLERPPEVAYTSGGLPTEIQLPAVSTAFMRGSMPTIPMLPNPKIVMALLASSEQDVHDKVKGLFQSDLLTVMDIGHASERDLIREIPLCDTIVLDEELFLSNAFLAGMTVGLAAGKIVNVVTGSAETQDGQIQNLMAQNLITLIKI